MRLMSITVATSALFLTCATALAAQPVDPGATIINEFGCLLLAADSGLDVTLFTDETTHAVNTPSGNSLLKCHFDIPAGHEPKKAIVKEGFSCGTFLGSTTNSQSVCAPGGKCDLTCQVKK